MKIGLLGLYLELYDRIVPECRLPVQANFDRVASLLRRENLQVIQSPVCRTRDEFAAAVSAFENAGAEAIVTLHLAYSPSLESAEVLAATALPLVILDTTPDDTFGFNDTDKLMANHGIHGVQDLCNLLIRKGEKFLIEAGHVDHSDVISRVVADLRSAAAARMMNCARVGKVGGDFSGMGDFTFDLKDLLLEGIPYHPQQVSDAEIDEEATLDRQRFVFGTCSDATYRTTLRESLKIRKWVAAEKLDAFTISFPGIRRPEWDCVPFLEASKAMARGIGYAGEGDVLTAAYCAAVMKIFPETTFSEM
ncbi:MAG: hypothetical protein PHS41_09735, partial [Victivallaceae bacterium]|nr:hypothetical protein [Victivallaceae bacterium]